MRLLWKRTTICTVSIYTVTAHTIHFAHGDNVNSASVYSANAWYAYTSTARPPRSSRYTAVKPLKIWHWCDSKTTYDVTLLWHYNIPDYREHLLWVLILFSYSPDRLDSWLSLWMLPQQLQLSTPSQQHWTPSLDIRPYLEVYNTIQYAI